MNENPNILPNVRLVPRWNDTRGDTVLATRAMTDMICDGVAAFFGPEGTCHVEAIVAQSRNIPMISYVSKLCLLFFRITMLFETFYFFLQKCSDYKASDVPTFVRTEPPDTQVSCSFS